MDRKKYLINLRSLQLWKAMSPIMSLPSPPKVMELLGFACTNSITFTLDQSNPLVMGKQNFYPLQFSMMFFGAIASPSFLSYDASWMDSSSFYVWSIHRRGQKPEPAEATTQMLLHLHPSFQHPNPMGICMTWIVEFFPGQPCLHGSWADECWAYKPFPAQNNSRFKILKMKLIM